MAGRRAPTARKVEVGLAVLLALAAVAGCRQSAPSDHGAAPSRRCVTCHLAEYQSVSHPPHPGVRATTCGTCHLETSWHPYRLNHSWPLEGAHAKANCFDCHRGEPRQFEGTSQECVSCHQDDRQTANQKVRRHEQFGTDCKTCHSAVAWKPTLPHEGAASNARATAAAANAPEVDSPTVSPAAASVAGSAKPVGAKASPAARAPGVKAPKAKPDAVTTASPVWRK